MPTKDRPTFEDALEKLETIVEKLSDQHISLEKSVELYEEGLRLSKICTDTLEQATLKIEQIDQSNSSGKEDL